MKEKIRTALELLGLHTATSPRNFELCVNCVLALTDDSTPNPIPAMKRHQPDAPFSAGATTQQIARQIQRIEHLKNPPDREGRDYWIKPLTEVGVLRRGYIGRNKKGNYEIFHDYHYTKSQNNFYFVDQSFRKILDGPIENLEKSIADWATTARAIELGLQKEVAERPLNTHSELLDTALSVFVREFIPDYHLIYRDTDDGARVPDVYVARLREAGIGLSLEDRFPDAILWNKETDGFWLLDVVESDGEFDAGRVQQIRNAFEKSRKRIDGFTTVYGTWKKAAARQSVHKNLAVGTSLWIAEDAAKVYFIKGIDDQEQLP